MERPAELMAQIYAWLGVAPLRIDPDRLTIMGAPESDSHYGMKYPHTQSERVARRRKHEVPPRIQAHIETTCAWYYHFFYPKQAVSPAGRPTS